LAALTFQLTNDAWFLRHTIVIAHMLYFAVESMISKEKNDASGKCKFPWKTKQHLDYYKYNQRLRTGIEELRHGS